MGSENNIIKGFQEELEKSKRCVEEVQDVLNDCVKSEVFQKIQEIFSNIPDDVQKTVLFQKCLKLKKKDLTYEEVQWIFDEFEISSIEDAKVTIQKYMNKENAIHSYMSDVIDNNFLENREKFIIILCHFERLIYSALRREKRRQESAGTMLKRELVKNNHGMDNKNLYKTILLAITNVVFANTDQFTNIDKRLPFRNNILHRGIVDYSDEEINIAYKTLLIFVASITRISGRL